MGAFDGLKGKVQGLFTKKEQQLILDIASLEKWPERIIRHQGIQDAVEEKLKELEKRKARANEAKSHLTASKLRDRFPERALPIYEEHLPQLVKEIDTLLKAAVFPEELFSLETAVGSFQEAVRGYKERTQKSQSALKEFLHEELQQANARIHDLEDASITLLPLLEERGLHHVKELQKTIGEFQESREKERKLIAAREQLLKQTEELEQRKLKIKEKIKKYVEQARTDEFKALFAEEEQLLEKEDAILAKGLPPEQLEQELKPVKQRLAFIRKQMINDITALNINEQRSFLATVKEDLSVLQRKVRRADELLAGLSTMAFRQRFDQLVLPFKARIEDADTIHEG